MDETQTLRILIVEDEPDVANTLRRVIEACGPHQVGVALSADALASALRQPRPDLVFTDLVMPDLDGFDVIRQVRQRHPMTPVVVLSAFATLDNAVRAVKEGAFDFLPKPFSLESVDLALTKVTRERSLQCQVDEARRLLADHDATPFGLIGRSPAMQQLGEWIYRARQVRANVLIEGESGTGKELVARALHGGNGPFVAVNMAAVPEALAESELFGHRKGAFTGAHAAQTGLFSQADGGVLFLDEVNSTPAAIQAKLLRVLADGRFRPLGASADETADVRVVSASNTSLESAMGQGGFRRDLFHRIRVLHIRIPPLRERVDDIPLLATHLLQRYARLHQVRARSLTSAALDWLRAQPWPGNVRELENAIEQAVIFTAPDVPAIDTTAFTPIAAPTPHPAPPAQLDSLSAAEQRHIQWVMERTNGNKTHAARILGIDYKTLLRKLNVPQA